MIKAVIGNGSIGQENTNLKVPNDLIGFQDPSANESNSILK